jgi:dephospho-CoA kinase
MIISAVGKNASGKDYFLEYISKKYGIPMLSIGDIARDLADKEGLEKNRENLHNISEKYMSTYGDDFFPKELIKKIKAQGLTTALVSGIRPPSDVEHFRKAFGDKFFLVAIVVEDDRKRYERTRSRNSARDNVTFEEFLAFDENEERLFQTSQTIAMADYTFYRGDMPDEEYHAKIEEFYNKYFGE